MVRPQRPSIHFEHSDTLPRSLWSVSQRFTRYVTMNETSGHHYDSETKQHTESTLSFTRMYVL